MKADFLEIKGIRSHISNTDLKAIFEDLAHFHCRCQTLDSSKLLKEMTRVHYPESAEVLTLNVGGALFQTTTTMLKNFPMSDLALMLNPTPNYLRVYGTVGVKQPDGSYFIDRDGTYFRFVLDYMRGCLSDKNKKQFADEILEEAIFYDLGNLKYEIQELKVCTVRLW